MSAASSLVTPSMQRAMSGLTSDRNISSVIRREDALAHGQNALAIEGLGSRVNETVNGSTGTGTAHKIPELGTLNNPKPE